jgi:hypothetical protein
MMSPERKINCVNCDIINKEGNLNRSDIAGKNIPLNIREEMLIKVDVVDKVVEPVSLYKYMTTAMIYNAKLKFVEV